MNQKRKNAFTLIELLAVIVILAIIALIAVPVIMNIIDKANKSAFKDSAYGIINAGELYFAERQLEPLGMLEDVTITLPDTTKTLELKGDIPEGSVTITKDGKVAIAVKNNRYCITKGINDTDVTITEDVENCTLPSGENNSGNNPEESGGDTPNEPTLPELGTTVENCTWEEISAIGNAGKADEYFNLGDTKTITLTTGEEVVMEIVAFNADEKTAGGYAAITWVSKNVLKTTHVMNTTDTNEGGWEASDMREWLQTDVYNTLPTEVKSTIVAVNKTYSVAAPSATSITKTCSDTVWIPSFREASGTMASIFGGESSGVTYKSFFENSGSLKKLCNGEESSWWYRSAEEKTGNQFSYMAHDGSNRRIGIASISRGVALGFCM